MLGGKEQAVGEEQDSRPRRRWYGLQDQGGSCDGNGGHGRLQGQIYLERLLRPFPMHSTPTTDLGQPRSATSVLKPAAVGFDAVNLEYLFRDLSWARS